MSGGRHLPAPDTLSPEGTGQRLEVKPVHPQPTPHRGRCSGAWNCAAGSGSFVMIVSKVIVTVTG